MAPAEPVGVEVERNAGVGPEAGQGLLQRGIGHAGTPQDLPERDTRIRRPAGREGLHVAQGVDLRGGEGHSFEISFLKATAAAGTVLWSPAWPGCV
jgi:hypothetical protein